VAAIALGVTGAAYTAHANFGRADLRAAQTTRLDAPVTAGVVNLEAEQVEAAESDDVRRWSPRWPRPTSAPTTPTPSSPTTTRPPTSPGTSVPTTPNPTPPDGSDFPGHVPGQFYLGMSCGTQCAEKERGLGLDYGVHRQFKQWASWSSMEKVIAADHRAGRLPWVSFKGPQQGAAGWRSIAEGRNDAELRQLAAMLKANDDQPIWLTFHHEPNNDGSNAEGKLWAAANVRIHDVLAEEGALENVAVVPIVSDWLFNPRNGADDPANWLTDELLSRIPLMGVDLYQNASGETYAQRIPYVRSWLKEHGRGDLMIAIGETGATEAFDSMTGIDWLNASLRWASANTDKVAAVSYFNSTANSKSYVYWPLDESAAKMAAFRSWLNNPSSRN
jgi:hypothetical protein